MKQLNKVFSSGSLLGKLSLYLASTVTVGMLALAGHGLLGQANARDDDAGLGVAIAGEGQIGALDQLLADFHGALSYGGNLTAMANLWDDEDSSLSLNGTSYVGKDAVMGFFANGPYFHNNWVSLAPEYKTVITIDGHTAHCSTQCVAVDLTSLTVKGVIQVEATAERHGGRWFFTAMQNSSPAPL